MELPQSNTLLPVCSYTRTELLSLRMKTSLLSLSTVDRLKDLNIGYHLPRCHRSSRGVKRKKQNLPSFIVASFNAQSVKCIDMACKRCEISTFIKDNGVDLFFVTETWLSAQGDKAKTAELAPSGFDVKSFPRQSRSRGGGIATVYKSTLGSNITFKTNFDFTHTSFEVVQASITLLHNTLHFFCLYRPPPNRRNNLTDSMFTEQLPDLLDYVNSLPGFVCLVGDMNIHFDNPLQSLTKQTLSTLSLYSLVQVINKPTHRCGHIIDCVIVRPDDDIHRKSTVTDSLESDHYCTKSYFNISVSKPSTIYRTVRNIANIDRPSCIAELSTVSEFSSVKNANQFCDFLCTVLDKHAPPSLRKVITHCSSPWFESIRDELFIAKRERRQAERKWKNTKLTIFKDLYRQAKQKVSKLVHTAKCKFYTERIALASSSKELYQIVNTLSNRHPPKILPTIYPSADLPSIFIKHFTNKVEKLRANIASEHVTSTLVTGTTAATFSSFEKVSQLTVKECILNSAPKSCELDRIPSKLLIECLDSILPSLTDLFNSSLASGIFPKCFKSALVTPMLKKGVLITMILTTIGRSLIYALLLKYWKNLFYPKFLPISALTIFTILVNQHIVQVTALKQLF